MKWYKVHPKLKGYYDRLGTYIDINDSFPIPSLFRLISEYIAQQLVWNAGIDSEQWYSRNKNRYPMNNSKHDDTYVLLRLLRDQNIINNSDFEFLDTIRKRGQIHVSQMDSSNMDSYETMRMAKNLVQWIDRNGASFVAKAPMYIEKQPSSTSYSQPVNYSPKAPKSYHSRSFGNILNTIIVLIFFLVFVFYFLPEFRNGYQTASSNSNETTSEQSSDSSKSETVQDSDADNNMVWITNSFGAAIDYIKYTDSGATVGLKCVNNYGGGVSPDSTYLEINGNQVSSDWVDHGPVKIPAYTTKTIELYYPGITNAQGACRFYATFIHQDNLEAGAVSHANPLYIEWQQ